LRPELSHIYHEQHPLSHAIALMRALPRYLTSSRKNSADAFLLHHAMLKNQSLELLFYPQPNITHTIDWDALMATKKNQPSFNLIEYKLSDAEMDLFDQWADKNPDTFQGLLAKLAEKDYKVSFSFVENSNSWCVSITGKPDAKFNEGATLTTWNDEPLEGLAMAVFKALVVFQGGVWKTRTESRRG
jgi:hypothetical protein